MLIFYRSGDGKRWETFGIPAEARDENVEDFFVLDGLLGFRTRDGYFLSGDGGRTFAFIPDFRHHQDAHFATARGYLLVVWPGLYMPVVDVGLDRIQADSVQWNPDTPSATPGVVDLTNFGLLQAAADELPTLRLELTRSLQPGATDSVLLGDFSLVGTLDAGEASSQTFWVSFPQDLSFGDYYIRGTLLNDIGTANANASNDTLLSPAFAVRDRLEVEISIIGEGSVTRLQTGADQLELRAVADDGSHFLGWRGNRESDDPVLDFTLDGNLRLTAIFRNASILQGFGATRELGNGWVDVPWFGRVFFSFRSWLYHEELGWLWFQFSDGAGVWLWSTELGWLYTRPDQFPWLFW